MRVNQSTTCGVNARTSAGVGGERVERFAEARRQRRRRRRRRCAGSLRRGGAGARCRRGRRGSAPRRRGRDWPSARRSGSRSASPRRQQRPRTRSIAPRLSRPQSTDCGAIAFGRKRAVGVDRRHAERRHRAAVREQPGEILRADVRRCAARRPSPLPAAGAARTRTRWRRSPRRPATGADASHSPSRWETAAGRRSSRGSRRGAAPGARRCGTDHAGRRR